MFTDDAIRIEKYYEEYGSKSQLHYLDIRTAGTISVHINSNRNGNGRRFENWLDYAVGWCAQLRKCYGNTGSCMAARL